MKFCWTTLHVKDLDISLNFYETFVGLKVNRRMKVNDQLELAFLGEGSTELELIQDANTPAGNAEGISIGFLVDGKLEPLMIELAAAGFIQQSEIISPNPTSRFFFVNDPDGFRVQFVENNR